MMLPNLGRYRLAAADPLAGILTTREAQAAHYASILRRTRPPMRRQFVKREWSTPIVVEVIDTDAARIEHLVRLVIGVRMTVRGIIDAAAVAFDVSAADILDHKRKPRYVVPRQIAMALANHKLSPGNLTALGRSFARDRSTVRHAIKKYGPLVARAVMSIDKQGSKTRKHGEE
jgi:hypothetical protein